MSPRVIAYVAALLLIVVTNAVVFVGVQINREGEAEARVTLSQRELRQPWAWRGSSENSELSLSLILRVDRRPNPTGSSNDLDEDDNDWDSSDWLDAKRLEALGFDVDPGIHAESETMPRNNRIEREVWLVLEVAGPAWQRALQRARLRAAQQDALLHTHLDEKSVADATKRAHERLQQEETSESRLFVVDVGTSSMALRTQYPDQQRYLIQRGFVRMSYRRVDHRWEAVGYVGDLAIKSIHVPHDLRTTLESALRPNQGSEAQYTVTLAVGQRLEPWIESVALP